MHINQVRIEPMDAFWTVENFLETSACEHFIAEAEAAGFEEAPITTSSDRL